MRDRGGGGSGGGGLRFKDYREGYKYRCTFKKVQVGTQPGLCDGEGLETHRAGGGMGEIT